MDIYKILETLKRVEEGTQQELGDQVRSTSEGVEQECGEPDTLANRLRARWEKTKQGIAEYGAVGPTGTAGTAATAQTTQPDPQATANIQKNLQSLKSKVPDINIDKATAALSKADTDAPLSTQDATAASALADPVANLIKDPQLGQQLQQLISKGMQKDQAAAQLAKQQGTV